MTVATSSVSGHPYNLRPDKWNPNDKHLSTVEPLHLQVLPDKVDLRSLMPPVINQGQLGSCSACSGVALRYAVAVKNNQTPPDFSPLFLYYEERYEDGDVNQDSGSTLATCAQVLEMVGVCPEADDPYDIQRFTVQPSAAAVADAYKWKITSSYRLNTLQEVLACLASGWPVHVGMVVYSELESGECAASGILSMPGPYDQPMGGHAVVAVGYDQSAHTVMIRNSWGSQWGQGGYFQMPYEYFQPRLIMDLRTYR